MRLPRKDFYFHTDCAVAVVVVVAYLLSVVCRVKWMMRNWAQRLVTIVTDFPLVVCILCCIYGFFSSIEGNRKIRLSSNCLAFGECVRVYIYVHLFCVFFQPDVLLPLLFLLCGRFVSFYFRNFFFHFLSLFQSTVSRFYSETNAYAHPLQKSKAM